jgi:hypothetical protein
MAAKAVAESMLRLLAGWAAPVGEASLGLPGLKGRVLTMAFGMALGSALVRVEAAERPIETSIDLTLPHPW